jgi:CHASE2 domain-containing sensor protein
VAKDGKRRGLFATIALLTGLVLVSDQSESLKKGFSFALQRLLGITHPEGHEDAITVVLADRRSLAHMEQPFPPTRAFHAAVLERLVALEPRAVFVDIWFDTALDEADPASTAVLADVMRERKPRTPVLVAGDPQRSNGGVSSVIRSAAYAVVPVLVHRGSDDLRIADYALLGSVNRCSAALHLYEIRKDPRRDPCRNPDAEFLLEHQDPLEVLWYTRAARDNVRTLGCSTQLRRALFERRPFCPPIRTVLAASLLSDGSRNEPKADPEEPWIKDRIVLYGISSDTFGDRVDTPVAAGVPGIYLHAMALRNLLDYESDYKRTPVDGWRWWTRSAAFLALIGALAALRSIVDVRDTMKPKYSRIQGCLRRLSSRRARIVVALIGVIVVSLALYAWVDVGPSGWMVAWLAWIGLALLTIEEGIRSRIKGSASTQGEAQ